MSVDIPLIIYRHLVDLILDSERENPLFRAPCGDDKEAPLHILDIGTGMGTWVMYGDPQDEPPRFFKAEKLICFLQRCGRYVPE